MAGGRRHVLLGASNVATGLPVIVDLISRSASGAFEILVAAGAGRCYGGTGRFLARRLPAISGCGLWPALERLPPSRTRALITDVGNDLMADRTPAEILRHVELCLSRLSRLGSEILVTELPLESLYSLEPWRFLAFRTLLFPGRRLSLDEVRARARELDEGLGERAARFGATLIRPRLDWYGPDGIHIRRRARKTTWNDLLSTWSDGPRLSAAGGRPLKPRLAAERSLLFGRERRRRQPAWQGGDGSTISFY